MQYAAAALALMAVPFVAAQSLGDLPKCALDAAQAGFAASSCQDADYACICKDSSFLSTIQQKIDSVCSADDQAKTIAFAQQLCVSAGTSLAIPSTGSSAAAPVANSPVASMATPAYPISTSAPLSTPPPYPLSNGSLAPNVTNGTAIAFTGEGNILAGVPLGWATLAVACAGVWAAWLL